MLPVKPGDSFAKVEESMHSLNKATQLLLNCNQDFKDALGTLIKDDKIAAQFDSLLSRYNEIGQVLSKHSTSQENIDGIATDALNYDISDFDQLLDQILENDGKEDENKNNDENSTPDTSTVTPAVALKSIPQSTQDFICTKFAEDDTMKIDAKCKYWLDFFDSGDAPEELDILNKVKYNTDIKDICKLLDIKLDVLTTLWTTYCRFRVNFFEKELKPALKKGVEEDQSVQKLKHIKNSQTKAFETLWNHFSFRGSETGVLPNRLGYKFEDYELFMYNLLFLNLTNDELNNIDGKNRNMENKKDLNIMVKYAYIWNGIYIVFKKGCTGYTNAGDKYRQSFDKYITSIDSVEQFIENCVYLIKRAIVNMGLFGKVQETKVETVDTAIKELERVWDPQNIHFQKLIEYCLQDINIKEYVGVDGKYLTNLKHILINRLAFVIFHDLWLCDRNNNNEQKQKQNSGLFFFNLIPVFKILWNFCVWYAMAPKYHKIRGIEREGEDFYIKQFWLLSNDYHWMKLNKNEMKPFSSRQDELIFFEKNELIHFHYFQTQNDGTLLHLATQGNIYCQLYL